MKSNIQINHKTLQQKCLELTQLKISQDCLVCAKNCESICYEFQQVAFKCWDLKNSKKDPFDLVWEQCSKQ